jgi:hypothetical protein
MATYSQVPTIVTGDLATASWGNTYIRDNFTWFADQNTGTTTINLDDTMSATEIQNEIDGATRFIPAGHNLVFQFADGSYSLSDTLTFDGFCGGGQLFIQGNDSESGLHTNQAVDLDFSASNVDGIVVQNSKCGDVQVKNIKIQFDSANGNDGIRLSTSTFEVFGCYLLGNSDADGNGIIVYRALCRINNTYVSNMNNGIIARYTQITSDNNDDTGTLPTYGLFAIAATIKKAGTQPSGSTANEGTQDGGVIE